MINPFVFCGLVLLALAATAACLKFAPSPFVWTFGMWSVLLLFLARRTPVTWVRAIFINVATVTLFACSAEVYFWWAKAVRESPTSSNASAYHKEGKVVDGYIDPNHPVLGYAPIKGTMADARKYYRDELVYDVVYTIDANGLRRSAPVSADANRGCILFFGGSFTVGEGVQDHETMPYRVGILTGGGYRTYNFGFHGYGAHQMLAALESGMVAQAAPCKPDYVIYQALDRHVLRSAGLVGWGGNGPLYVLNSDGSVRRDGSLQDKEIASRLSDSILRQLDKSHLYTWMRGRSQSHLVRDEHIEVFGGIVEGASDYIHSMSPHAKFHVLLWEFDSALTTRVVAELQERRVRLHWVRRDILPTADYRETYALGLHDHHPNPSAYDLIARYIVAHIIEPTSAVER